VSGRTLIPERSIAALAESDGLAPTNPRVRSLDDLVGLDEVKFELRAQLRLWAYPGQLERIGGKPRVGFIFCGPTGTGKTTAAHALAAESGRDLYTLSGAEFHDEAGKDRLGAMLASVATRAAVVFVDEADDLLHQRDFGRETSDSLVKFLLVALDRTARDIAAFFIFATNLDVRKIDAALVHPGRLGRPIQFRQLHADEREELLLGHAHRYRLGSGARLDVIARRLAGVPTAAVAYLLDEAAFVAWSGGHDVIRHEDLQEAVTRLRSGLQRARPWSDEDLRRAAAHEAGHALARLLLERRWSAVAFVEVNPRAEGAAGVTHPDEPDVEAFSELLLKQQLVEALAGREAERILLGSTDTGSADDLARANELADNAARVWGFSDRGPRTFDEYPDAVVEGRLDDAALALLVEGERSARSLLTQHLPALSALTERLRIERSAGGPELRAWLAPHLADFVHEDDA
jgi:ATP-dependent Zn protease